MKLGPGEFNYTEDEKNVARNEARRIFLAYIEQLAPEVMSDLYSLMPNDEKPLNNLLDDIQVWAKDNNLNENWIINRAVNSLLLWTLQPELKGRWGGDLPVCLGLLPGKETFIFDAEEWNPAQKTWR